MISKTFSIKMREDDKIRWNALAQEYNRTLSGLIKDLLREFERNPDILNPTATPQQEGVTVIDVKELQRIHTKLDRLDQKYTSLVRQGKSFLKSDEEALFG